jgi:hypothetical protein
VLVREDDRGGRPWWTTVVDDRGGRPCLRLGHSQVDRYLDFVSARARPNTTLAAGCDLKVFSSVVAKEPVEVTTSDVLGFITTQRGDHGVVRLADGESGLSARTIQWRLSSISGLFGFLLACGEADANLGASWVVESETVAQRSGHAAGSHAADVLGARRGRRVARGVSSLA